MAFHNMNMTVDYHFLDSFILEQKSIFEKEKNWMSDIISVFIQEYRGSVIQIGSVCAFVVTILFGMINFNWVTEATGQTLIAISIIITAGLIFSVEFLRGKFLVNRLEIIGAYNDALWTMSDLKRTLTLNIVLKTEMDYRDWYFFIFCAVCSERVKILTTIENLLKNSIFKLKANDLKSLYSDYEGIIKIGKATWESYSDKFKSLEHFKKLLESVSPLENYKLKS